MQSVATAPALHRGDVLAPFLSLVCFFGLLAIAGPALAQTPIQKMGWRPAPSEEEVPRPKALNPDSLESMSLYASLELPAVAIAEQFRAKSLARSPEGLHGFGRTMAHFGVNDRITVPAGATAVRIRVKSPGAAQVRVGLTFADGARYSIAAYQPGDAPRAVTVDRPGEADAATLLWSPVTNGDEQELVVQRPIGASESWSFNIVKLSHIDGALAPNGYNAYPGQSAYCQADIVCTYAVAPPRMLAALPDATRAVAMMVFTAADGLTYSCTGTLLNSANFPAPLLYTANHCVTDAQSLASLTTFWFYSRDYCGYGPPSANTIQVAGGALAIFRSISLDAALVLLNNMPPAKAAYAGWDATPMYSGTEILAVHHPMGDVKKGSFGSVYAGNSTPVTIGEHTYAPYTFYLVDWQVGIVEPGSSGSGLFTYNDAQLAFYTHGTLTGGATTCGGGYSRTYYSQLDNVFPYISEVLNVKAPAPGQLQVPSPVTFPAQQVGTQSASITITITNIGGSTVNASRVTATNLAEFPATTTCVTSIAAGANCHVTLSFLPSAIGTRSETITITSDGVGSPQTFSASGTGSTAAASFSLNQHGLTGSWYEATTSGQGVEVEVYPNPSSGTGSSFVSWFTYDTVAGGAERQRWYTAQGPVVTGQPNASLTIYQNTDGNLNAPPVTNAQAVGTATLSFSTCSSGQLSYSFTDGTGRTGTIPLTRLTQNVTCSATAPYPTNADFALSGNWYGGATTSGQGFTTEVNPKSGAFFSAWYTYMPNGTSAGAAGQRWYTAQGAFTPGKRSIPVQIYETTGGTFDKATPPSQKTVVVGSGTMNFLSCSAATFIYNFTGGTSIGLSGTITLSRVGPVPPGCTS